MVVDGIGHCGWHVTDDHYNYERFDDYVAGGAEQREFGAFADGLHAGDAAPDIRGVSLDGSNIPLSQVWSRQPVVVEFGSFT